MKITKLIIDILLTLITEEIIDSKFQINKKYKSDDHDRDFLL
jgi:hypothetical protein